MNVLVYAVTFLVVPIYVETKMEQLMEYPNIRREVVNGCEWREETYGTFSWCKEDEIAIGSCGSGRRKDCQGNDGKFFHGLYCCKLPGYSVDYKNCENKRGSWGQNVDCDQRSVRSACGSGFRKDCDNSAHMVYCCDAYYYGAPLIPAPRVDSCYWEYTRNYGEKVYCKTGKASETFAIFGRCGSGNGRDCHGGNDVHGIKCCEITVDQFRESINTI